MINNSTNNAFQYDVVEVNATSYTLLNNTLHVIKTEDVTELLLPAASNLGDTFMVAKMTAYNIKFLPNPDNKIWYIVSSSGNQSSSSTGLQIVDAAETARLYRLFKFVRLIASTTNDFNVIYNQYRSSGTGYPLIAI